MSFIGNQIFEFLTFAVIGSQKKSSGLSDESFANALRAHSDLWKRSFMENTITCCPVSVSLGGELSRDNLMSHILVPDRKPGEYRTLKNEQVYICGNEMICGVGFSEARKVKILSVEQMSDANGAVANVLRLSRPLVGGIAAPEEIDEISIQVMYKYVAILRSFPEAESAFVILDEYLKEVNFVGHQSKDGFSRVTPSMSASLRSRWERTTERLMRTGALTTCLGTDPETAKLLIGQIVESYMMAIVADTVYPWLHTVNNQENTLLLTVIRATKKCSQSDLGIMPELQCPQHEAIAELQTIGSVKTPVDKMLVMKRTVTFLRESVDRNVQRNFPGKDIDMATDDLVLLLIYVIAQSFPTFQSLADDVRFVSEFHFISSSRSQLGFTLCHFQVALTWFADRINRADLSSDSLSDGSLAAISTDGVEVQVRIARKLDVDFGDNISDISSMAVAPAASASSVAVEARVGPARYLEGLHGLGERRPAAEGSGSAPNSETLGDEFKRNPTVDSYAADGSAASTRGGGVTGTDGAEGHRCHGSDTGSNIAFGLAVPLSLCESLVVSNDAWAYSMSGQGHVGRGIDTSRDGLLGSSSSSSGSSSSGSSTSGSSSSSSSSTSGSSSSGSQARSEQIGSRIIVLGQRDAEALADHDSADTSPSVGPYVWSGAGQPLISQSGSGSSSSTRSRPKHAAVLNIISERTNKPGGILSVTGSAGYFAAVNVDLHAFTWGAPDSGRLGHGVEPELDNFLPLLRPREVLGLGPEVRVRQLACGKQHMLAVTDAGEVFAWGDNRCQQLGLSAPSGPPSFSAWGTGKSGGGFAGGAPPGGMSPRGLIMDDPFSASQSSMRQLSLFGACSPTPVMALRNVRVQAIACGAYHSLCLATDGSVYSWGRAANGRLGQFEASGSVGQVVAGRPALVNCNWVSTVYTPGDVEVLEATPPMPPPTVLSEASKPSLYSSRPSTGHRFSYTERIMHKSTSYTSSAVSSSATTSGPTSGPAERRGSLGSAVITTATPASAQGTGSGHGKGHGFGQASMAHQQASSGLNARVVSIAAGFSHSIAVTSAGAVFTWGCGTFGRLGHGSHCDEYLPKQVHALSGPNVKIVQASGGKAHSAFLTEGGLLFACGLNKSGQVGPTVGTETNIAEERTASPLRMQASKQSSSVAPFAAPTRTQWKLDMHCVLGPRPVGIPTPDAPFTTETSSQSIGNDVGIPRTTKSHFSRVSKVSCGDSITAVITFDERAFVMGAMIAGFVEETSELQGCKEFEKHLNVCDVTAIFNESNPKQISCSGDCVMIIQ